MNKNKIITIISIIIAIICLSFFFEGYGYTMRMTDLFEEPKLDLSYILESIARSIILNVILIIFLIKYIYASVKKEKYFDIKDISKCTIFLNVCILIIGIVDMFYYKYILADILGALPGGFMMLAIIPFEIAYVALIIWLNKLKKEKLKKTKIMKLENVNGYLPVILYTILTCIDSVNYSLNEIIILLILPIIFMALDIRKIIYNKIYNIIILIINIIIIILCISNLL